MADSDKFPPVVLAERPSAAPAAGHKGETNEPGRLMPVARRQAIFHAGDPATHYYRLEQGAVAVVKPLSDGQQRIVEVLQPGDLFGVAVNAEHEFSAQALQSSLIRLFDRREIDRRPAFGELIRRQLETQLCRAYDHEICLSHSTASERVACFLLQMIEASAACSRKKLVETPVLLRMPLTRREIGEYLGISLETVSRTLTDFDRRGLVRIGKRQGEITVLNPCQLCEIAADEH